jgi:hypothetical protein
VTEHSSLPIEALAFWATPGRLTTLDGAGALPADLDGAVRLVNGLLVHEFWAAQHWLEVPAERRDEVQIRSAAAMIDRIRELEPSPLGRRSAARAPAGGELPALRGADVRRPAPGRLPVRARCGHATYFEAGRYVDHWGAWFVRNNVVRDLAALNGVEALPWDQWGPMDRESALGEGPADELVDEVAAVTAAASWPRLRRLYESDERLTAPETLR